MITVAKTKNMIWNIVKTDDTCCSECKYLRCSKDDWAYLCSKCLNLIVPKLVEENKLIPELNEENSGLREENAQLRKEIEEIRNKLHTTI